jgi:AcrR family transcriptional regulator
MIEIDPDKDKIIKYAQQLFFREGFYKITMDELARELQISKKTIYKFFLSKEKLVEEIIENLISTVDLELSSIIYEKENVVWKFAKVLNMYHHLIIKFTDKWRHDIQIHAPHIWVRIDRFRAEKIYSCLEKLLEQGKKEKLIHEFPNEIIIASFISTIREVINPDFVLRNKFSMHQAFIYTFELLMNGILTKQGLEKYNRMKEDLEIEVKSN